MNQPGRQRRRRLGSYGAGTLWCFRSRNGLFMLFNDHLIAKRGHPRARAWLPFDVSWIVTSIVRGELLVQHNDDEGVIVSLRCVADAEDRLAALERIEQRNLKGK
jgi:hypothetical protein